MKTVWVPQEPSRLDPKTKLWMPTVSLQAAAAFGNIEILLPPGMSTLALVPIRQALKEKLVNSGPEDFLVAVGDPAIIAMCAVILARKHGKLNMLKWDKNNSGYLKVEVEI